MPINNYNKLQCQKDQPTVDNIHVYPMCNVTEKINAPHLCPGGIQYWIVFEVFKLSYIWGNWHKFLNEI